RELLDLAQDGEAVPQVVGDSRGDLAGGAETLFELEGGEHAADQDISDGDREQQRHRRAECEQSERCPSPPQRFLRGLLDGDGPTQGGQGCPAGEDVTAFAVPQPRRRGSSATERYSQRRLRDWFTAEHRGPHRSGSRGEQPSNAVERERVPLLSDADAL